MARTRTTLEILPNLHTLEWRFEDVDCMERAMIFMHQRVRHLVISAPPLRYNDKSSFFLDICARMPNLLSLDLRVPYSVHLIEGDILELLRGLPHLKEVIFPEFFLTSTIVSELSRKKHISIIRFECGSQQGLGEEEDIDSFSPILEQGAFPVLQDLSITASLGDVIRFMNADFSPINITSLFINTYIELEPEQLHTFLATLSQKCPLLVELYIRLLHVPAQLELVPAKQITFDTLRPVLSFLNLTVFMLVHVYPVNITPDEIEELASRWPSLEYLRLNEEPLVMHDFTLDLQSLISFARHCPKLLQLGLFMDASATKIHPTQELNPFTSLELLCVGTSLAGDPCAVVALLSCLFPPGCQLDASITWTSYGGSSCRGLDTDLLFAIENRFSYWDNVSDLLYSSSEGGKEEIEGPMGRS